ncbi:MAG: hypothetical protein NTY12_03450 [Candidatus Falkowbacteria bacterium]|nr:hypothetical protein [Candidatus Falkowbacteria bacterium]
MKKQTKKHKIIKVNDKMQSDYHYELSETIGKNFHQDFKPELTPKQMLALGIFGGKYMTDCKKEFPKDWFTKAKLSETEHDANLNYFKINASQSLDIWKKKGWLDTYNDPRGWFQWYCRYYYGRRLPGEDERQIKRWKAINRHIAQIKKNCRPGDINCRRKQRQAVLHWAYDSRKI